MIPIATLLKIARTRLGDAEILYSRNRLDGAMCLCGYAIELALKARICKTLKWGGFPETSAEFVGLQQLVKIHQFESLIRLSGVEQRIQNDPVHTAAWNHVCKNWNEQIRYKPIGSHSKQDVSDMIGATKILLKVLR